jgi:NADPH:quinone reductase-like Zn-dependent oxidoreductase
MARVPSGIDAASAALIGLVGVAALDALAALDVQPGETVLISGATGGVGSIALQLAAATGATVIGTARPGPAKEYVRGLGATHTVDYTSDVAAAVQAVAPQGVDKVLHAAGDAAALGKTLRPGGGLLVSTRGATSEEIGRDAVTVAGVMAAATADKLAQLLDDVAAGKLRVNTQAAIPLDNATDALEAFGNGKLGKVLLTR